MIILHLLLMTAATICLTAGIGMAMFGRRKTNWLKLHRTFNTSGSIIAFIGAVAAFSSVVTSEGVHLAKFHHQIGLTTVLLISLALFLGYYSFKAGNKAAVRTAHRWSGRLSFIAMLSALILGLKMIGIF